MVKETQFNLWNRSSSLKRTFKKKYQNLILWEKKYKRDRVKKIKFKVSKN